MLVADDLPYELWPHSGSSGREAALLPRTAALVDAGLRLRRHYAYPLCGPSRASMLTGRYPHRAYFADPPSNGRTSMSMSACKGMSPGATSLAEKLRYEAGYRTAMVGKWHVGYASLSYAPWARGFESAHGFFASGIDHFTKCSYIAPRPDNKSAASWCRTLGPGSSERLYDWFEHERGDSLDAAAYLSPGHPRYNDTYIAYLHQESGRQIVANHNTTRDQPLFLYYAFAAVHSPLQAPPELLARVDQLRPPAYFPACGWFDWGTFPNPSPFNPASPVPYVPSSEPTATCNIEERRLLEAMALSMDDTVGILVDALRQKGMWDSSLIVFVSDNGGAINQHATGASNSRPSHRAASAPAVASRMLCSRPAFDLW